jgi:hypothetical protein
MSLRADLERVRMLSEQVQKRERHKLERLRKQKAYLEIILFPLEYILKPILEELMELVFNIDCAYTFQTYIHAAITLLDLIGRTFLLRQSLTKLRLIIETLSRNQWHFPP